MRIAIYAIRTSEKWKCCLSLDMQVDFQWWCGVNRWIDENERACSLVLLSTQVPLGWAVVIQRDFDPSKTWINGEIGLAEIFVPGLKFVLLQEPEGSRTQWSVLFKEIQKLDGSYVNSFIEKRNVVGEWDLLMRRAEPLIQCMAGRALLAGEVEALLAEVAGDTGDWRSAAQFGVLLGRLRLEAGWHSPPRSAPGWRAAGPWPRAGDAARGPKPHGMRRVRLGGLRLLRGVPRDGARPRQVPAAMAQDGHGRGPHRGLGPVGA